MSYFHLPLDVHNDIYSFLPNKDLNPILKSSRETQGIASRYLQPHINNNETIKISAERGDVEAVRFLLQDPRVDASVDDNHAIREAFKNRHWNIIKLLLQNPRVDPSISGNYIIKDVSRDGHIELAELLFRDS